MAIYTKQLRAAPTNTFAIASNSVSAFLFYPGVSGNNGANVISFNTTGLGTPTVTASSALDITTTWGDTVKILLYHNSAGPVTFLISNLSSRKSDLITARFNAARAVTAVVVAAQGIGDNWTSEFGRKHNLGYF